MKEFNYQNDIVYYTTIHGDRNGIMVQEGDYKDVDDVRDEFSRFLKSREGVGAEPENPEDLFVFVYACSKGWIK